MITCLGLKVGFLGVRAGVALDENILPKVLFFDILVIVVVLDDIRQSANRRRDKLRQILVEVELEFVANNGEFGLVVKTKAILELPVPTCKRDE